MEYHEPMTSIRDMGRNLGKVLSLQS